MINLGQNALGIVNRGVVASDNPDPQGRGLLTVDPSDSLGFDNTQGQLLARNGATLVVAGIDWAKSAAKCGRFVEQTCGEETNLLLAHNPKAFGKATELRIPLTLSGHTHGGHVALKSRPNVNLALAHRKSHGLFENGPSRLYVTTGVGDWFPLRVNCPAEFAIITMRHAPQAFVVEDVEPKKKRKKRKGKKKG